MGIGKIQALSALVFAFILVSSNVYAAGLELNTDKSEYSVGETIRISGFSDFSNVTISITGLFPLNAVKVVGVENGIFGYDYNIIPGDQGKVLIKAEAGAIEKEKQIFIKDGANNSLLDIGFITPANGERFYREDNLTIKLRVTKGGLPVNDASVVCKLVFPGQPSAGATIELLSVGEFFTDTYQITENDIKEGGVYYRDYQIGRGDPTQIWIIKCVAQKDGEKGGGSRSIRVVNSLIIIDFLSPTESAVENGARLDVIVRAYYQDGSPVRNALVLIEDSDGRLAKMDKLSDSGIFEFKNYDTISNSDYLSMTATASDDAGNAGKKSIVFRVVKNNLPGMLYKLWWTIPMVITIILLTLYLEKQVELSYTQNVSKPKKLKNEIEDLEEERRNITSAKALVEENYYRRKIDEKAFRRMMEDYEQKAIEINIKIKRLKEELKEFD
ncbi:MAG: hypothetical protein HY515_03385 [Candidatus Aenigmarchaeota archaeon]|nr:hypothetical protein [Candidatus Aenigmarchaeota archaeon]